MTELVSFLETMPYWYWFVLAGILLVAEISTGTTYLLWPAIAAALVGLLDMGPMDGAWQWQLAIFAVITISLTIFVTPLARDWLHKHPMENVDMNERGVQQIGRSVTALHAFENGSGQVKLDDTVWLAQLAAGDSVAQGERLVVTQIRGATLIVNKT